MPLNVQRYMERKMAYRKKTPEDPTSGFAVVVRRLRRKKGAVDKVRKVLPKPIRHTARGGNTTKLDHMMAGQRLVSASFRQGMRKRSKQNRKLLALHA